MKTKLFFAFAAFCCIFLAYGTYQGLVVAPTEETMGDVQRIFYVHVPAATVAFTLFFVNFLASIYYLWKRSAKADALAATTAEVGVVFCSVVLITGPIWARYAWGTWWSPWDMRLNTTLMLWLLVCQLSDDAPLFDGRFDFSFGGSAGGLFFSRCADRLHGQPLVPHPPSRAHALHAQHRSPNGKHHVHQHDCLPLLQRVDLLVPL